MAKPKLPTIPAVTSEELSYAYQIGGLAASGTIPGSGVKGMGVNLDMGDGDVQRLELADIPMNRAAIAIRDQFPKGMLVPLMSRLFALMERLEDKEADLYKRDVPGEPGQTEFSGALFSVAARMPLNARMSFVKKQFFQQVAVALADEPDLQGTSPPPTL